MKALQDPAVAAHYKGFDLSQAHTIAMDHDLWAFVSYRVETGIYWTARPRKIRAGELVITDGTNYIRASCGNLIAYAPQSPIAEAEPMDLGQLEPLRPPEIELPFPPNASTVPPAESQAPPVAPPPPVECCGGVPPPPIIITGGAPPPPVAVTPEPEMLHLVTLGLLFLMTLFWLKRK